VRYVVSRNDLRTVFRMWMKIHMPDSTSAERYEQFRRFMSILDGNRHIKDNRRGSSRSKPAA
jgi:hypothetical protein